MSAISLKIKQPFNKKYLTLADHLDSKSTDDKKWYLSFLDSILSSPDLDYSQFDRIESKRTISQIHSEYENSWK